ncbi:hypothetical protein LOY64_08465 [Pseudomonas corrugata]|uniref:hypothetical protein n=1 Tax=Pseudomonas corrugata TaxID=47879 RepID=UPI002230BD27|nr:hypothetical protein [Pseudomonas corrugata]MDU9041578.1 hypothetical protein [Pseudomonas corrugata]UZD97019.1 hypothetical protein LOY64_08465 [Pseudomonas corrugata]
MLNQPRKYPAPLALRAPDIPGRSEQDLPSGEWGLNLAAVLGTHPNKGLKVHIPSWPITGTGIGDNVKLLLDGGQVDQHTITQPVEVGERVTLWVAPGRLQTGSYELTYVVKRPSQTEETYTPPVRLYVKLELPGGQDTDPDPGSHSELYMDIDPELVENGVDDDDARNGVDITIKAKPGSPSPQPYPNIAEGDLIYLSWGGVEVISDPVSQAQIDDPGNNPIIVHVSETVIRDEAGDSGPEGLAVTFKIHDRVNNASEDWCPETRLVVDTGNSRLEAPILEQADGNLLDLDTLGDAALQLQVWAANTTLFAKNDVIIMRIKGTTLDGDPIEETARQAIEENPPTVVNVLLPNSAARALAKTQAVFSYKLERGGTIIQQSKGRFINIIGEPNLLAAPIAEDAQGGALDPDLTSTRIRIPFDERIEEDMAIELKWFGTRPDQSSYEPELEWYFPSRDEVESKEDFFIPVDGRHLKTLEGGTLDLSYNLLSDENGEIVSRGSRHAAPVNVGEPQFELVRAIVVGEQNGALEPGDLPNGTSKVTCPAPVANPTKSGDVVSWQLFDAQGTKLFDDSKTLTALNAGKNVDFPLNAAFVQQHFEAHRGEELTVKYDILRFDTGKYSYATPLEFVIGEARQPLLDPAKVREAIDDVLDPADATGGAHIDIEPNRAENAGDHFYVTWATTDGATTHTDDKSITGSMKGKPVEFPVPRSIVLASEDKTVIVSYRVELLEGGDQPGEDYELLVQHQAFRLPEATFREATGPGQDQLNPDDVYPNGATVIIPATALLKTDDEITVTVQGQATTYYSHTVLPTEADKELASIKVPHAVINANEGNSIALDYTVARKAGGTDGPSTPTEYDVRRVIGSGTLKVMGARYTRSTYRASAASRILSAFNATTGQPIQAQWKYPTETAWTTAATWRDTQPHQPLQVRTTDDQLALNPANIIGNGIDTTVTGFAAFVAHRDVGDVVGWGNEDYGGKIPATIITLTDIVEVSCTRSAYAARRANSAVVAWGTETEGGAMTGIDPLNFAQVVGNATAFTGLKTNGRIVAWGVATDGGTIPEAIGNLTDILEVISAGQAFAAIRATGQVVAWGLADNGGTVPSDIEGFTDIKTVIGSFGAFAAHRGNGRIVAWGHDTYGASVPPEIAALTDITELSCANAQAFTARRATGQVVAWGTAEYGGTIDPLIEGLTDIVEISSTWRAFAARRGNGHVVAWGRPAEGGLVPDDIATLDDIVQVTGSSMAFAALRKNGTVVAWGNATVGGDTTSVVGELTQVQALYSNTHGFVALTADGRVVTWGHPDGGGDSSAKQDKLEGQVSYTANSASRGLALKANRLAGLVR